MTRGKYTTLELSEYMHLASFRRQAREAYIEGWRVCCYGPIKSCRVALCYKEMQSRPGLLCILQAYWPTVTGTKLGTVAHFKTIHDTPV